MKHLVAGLGQVGKATRDVLASEHEVWGVDLDYILDPKGKKLERELDKVKYIDCLHIAFNYYEMGHEKFVQVVKDYLTRFDPSFLDILSTVRPGTTELFGAGSVHSTTRGLHPHLVPGIMAVPKHVGGPAARSVAKDYRACGVTCVTHLKSTTTELLHIINNSHYGVNLMFADEAARLCREYGVSYLEYMRYTETHNAGFRALDHEGHVRPILTPPNGRLGGHCVVQGTTLLKERGPLLELLAHYNDQPTQPGRVSSAIDNGEPIKEPGSSVEEQSLDRRQADGSIPSPATEPPPGCMGYPDHGSEKPCPVIGCEDDHAEDA